MTHRKKKKIAGIIRLSMLILLPSVIAASASCIGRMNNLLKSESKTAEEQSTYAVTREDNTKASEYKKTASVSPDDLLTGSLILSEGYGVNDETTDTSPKVKLKDPTKTVSDDAGPKPYPTSWSDGGTIIRNTYQPYSGNCFFDLENGGQVNNKSDIPNETLIEESRCLPNFEIGSSAQPQVLIYHTHTSESFEPYVRESYDPSFNYRTTDETKNVVMVGDAIQAELEAQGFNVIHVRTIHDYPSYNGAYDRSRASIQPILEQYPSIKVALDIHRDAISGENVAYQPYITVDNKEAAQIMIISGCDDGTLDMPNFMKNFHFASSLQQQLESDTPGLTRPILFDYRKYNQDLTTGSLLIEVGSHGNTLEQVQYSGQLFGRSLARLLKTLKKED